MAEALRRRSGVHSDRKGFARRREQIRSASHNVRRAEARRLSPTAGLEAIFCFSPEPLGALRAAIRTPITERAESKALRLRERRYGVEPRKGRSRCTRVSAGAAPTTRLPGLPSIATAGTFIGLCWRTRPDPESKSHSTTVVPSWRAASATSARWGPQIRSAHVAVKWMRVTVQCAL
jgi:hypothetical protein